MKNLITLILFLFCSFAYAQKFTLLEINAKWNQNNKVYLPNIKDVENIYVNLEDQAESLKSKISSIPVVILYKDDIAVYQWTADLSFKLEVTEAEIKQVIFNNSK